MSMIQLVRDWGRNRPYTIQIDRSTPTESDFINTVAVYDRRTTQYPVHTELEPFFGKVNDYWRAL